MAGFMAQSSEHPSSSPRRQNLVDLIADFLTGCITIHSLCQQSVVLGMIMPNCRDDRYSQSALLQVPARLRPTNAPASPGGGVFGDCSEFMRRAAGEQNPDLLRHAGRQLAVFFASSHGLARASRRPLIRIFRTFPLGFFQG